MLDGDIISRGKRAVRPDKPQRAAIHAGAGRSPGMVGGWSGRAPWLDGSSHVCPVIGTFISAWHEGLAEQERAILVPLFPRIVRTRTTPPVEEQRALLAADWLVRTYAPAWLDLAGLRELAQMLYDLPETTKLAHAFEIRAVLAQVSHRANAEALGVGEAAWIKASDDCWASGWAAAFDAARLAANDPAWISAAAASRAAAGLSAWTMPHAFKLALQTSAAELLLRMTRLGQEATV